MFEEDEEYKKKLERARQLRNSIGMVTNKDKEMLNISSSVNNITNNPTSMFSDNNVETDYQQKLKRARELRNSIGMITIKDKEIDEIQRQINESKNNNFVNLPSVNSNITSSTLPRTEEIHNNEVDTDANKSGIFLTSGNKKLVSQNKENTKTISKEELNAKLKQANKMGVSASIDSTNKNVLEQNTKMTLANPKTITNVQEVSSLDLKARKKAEEKNKRIKEGGLAKFEELMETTLNNIPEGFMMKPIAGLVNVITTAIGVGIKGLESASKIVNFQKVNNNLSQYYNNVIDFGSLTNEIANNQSEITNQVNNDFIKTSGNISNVISNMAGIAGLASVLPVNVSPTSIMGLSVGGSSAQEVLDKNKDNIVQASLTGIAKGYTSYLTEKIFDANILTKGTKKNSIQKTINRLISNKMNSEFGKEIANKTIGVIGENIEELVDNNAGYLIDNLINNKDLPDFKKWFEEQSETVKTTTLSTIIMNLLGLGGTSFKEIEKNADAQYWIDQAQQIIDQENLAIHFNPSEVKNINQTFYITRFTPEGEIANIVPTKGKTINNSKPELNVTPVVVLDSNTKMYNVIDGNTGVVLDSTPYSTTLQAEGGFNDKANKLNDLQIKDINNKISEANYMINNEILSAIEQAQEQLKKMTPIDYKINNKKETSQRQYTKEQYDKITRTVNQISDDSTYNFEEANNAFDIVSNNIKNVNVIEQSGNRYLNSLDKEGYVVYQQKLNKKKYTGKDMKEIINTAISHADTSNIYEEINVNNIQASSEPNASNFYTNETNYAVQNIKKVTEAFSKQKSYSKDKLAEIWNNEVSDNNYDAYYGKDGNIERYIAIEEDGDNIVVNQYDDNDNIVKSEVIPSKNGKYSAKAVKDTIERVSSLYNENRPIKGQRDIEGNEVLSMKKKTLEEFNTRNQYKNVTELLNAEVEKTENNFNTNIKIEQIDELENINFKKITQNEYIKLSKNIFKNSIKKRSFQNDNSNIKIKVILDDIKESAYKAYSNKFQNKYLKEHIQALSKIDIIIENANEKSKNIETKSRNQYKDWKYFISKAIINDKPFLIEFDVTNKNDGYHFRLQRLVELNLKNNRDTTLALPKNQGGANSR